MGDKALATLANSADRGLAALEALRAELPALPTAQLVSGYLRVKDFEKRVKDFTAAVRNELVYGPGAKEKEYRGRFFVDEGVEVDEKGHRFLCGEGQDRLRAQKRVSVRVNQEKALSLLRAKGIADDEVMDRSVKLEPAALDALVALRDELLGSDSPELRTIGERLAFMLSQTFVEYQFSESKFEALVVLEKVSLAELGSVTDSSTTYALYEEKSKGGGR